MFRHGHTVNLLDTQIGLVEAEEGVAIIPSFGLPACRNQKVTMSVLVDPVVSLESSAFLKRYIARWAGEAGALTAAAAARGSRPTKKEKGAQHS